MGELTKCEVILIHWLKAIGMNEDDTVAVMASLETVEQQDMLANFLERNKNATDQEVLRETVRILKVTSEWSRKKMEFNGKTG